MNTYLVTGTTRGLGLGLVQAIADRGDVALTLSSAPDSDQSGHVNVQADLADAAILPSRLDLLLERIDPAATEALVLINNAGLLEPLMPLERAAADSIGKAYAVNLVAPAILMAHFLSRTEKLTLPRRIINISSGAATKPYSGWGCYCSSKAGLEMLTRCVAEEQARGDHPAHVCAVAPGVVDTDMQRQVRETTDALFPHRQKFVQLHQQGALAPPLSVAHRLLALDEAGRFKSGGCHDLREFRLPKEG
ncbi:MAG: SDR family NAD(P)-dependent oxidoreductase [Desulfosarcinaceae bacterium]|jgi:benzil reductase ((S)-benzoin forming)